MRLALREMRLDEVGLVIEYFHGSTAEHLEMLGVDPARLPDRHRWRARYEHDYARPRPEREMMLLLWELDGAPVGFSTTDRIAYGEQAFMHLHIVEAVHRRAGVGAAAIRASVELYFGELRLQRLFCEPNAFNIAPNRALQRAGFRYVKTHMTVPGPLNFHQAATRWVIER